jgi:MFS family permease
MTTMRRIGPEQQGVLGLALVAAFAEAAYAIINALALPVFVDRELQAISYLGTIGGSFLLVETLLKGPMGVVSDRVGRRLILIVAPLGSALAAVALTWAHAPFSHGLLAYLIGVRCLDGVAAAALWTTMYAAVADQVPEERRASAMSTLTVSYLVGLAIGPWLGGWASTMFSVRASFYLVAALFVLTSTAAVFLVPRRSPHAPSPTEHGEEISMAGFIDSLRQAPQFLIMAMVVFLGVGLLYMTAPLLALHEFGLDEEQYGRLFVIPAVIIGVLTVPLGRLGDRWGASRSVHLGMGTAALSLWALTLLPKTKILMVLGASALGMGFVVGVPAWMAVISRIADPRHRGAMIGAVATAQGIGAFGGVVVGPMLFNAAGLADRLDPLWPGGSLSSHLLPVLGAALLVTVTWLASLVVVRERVPVAQVDWNHR